MRILTALLLVCMMPVLLQAQTTDALRESARNYQKQGDYSNAILVLSKARSQEPKNTEIQKELGIAYYVARQYDKALEVIRPVLDGPDADEQTYQIAAILYRATDDMRGAEKTYKAGIKQFPQSGILYYEYGNLLESKDPGMGKGISLWEKGIEVAPEYPGNYFGASKYYAGTGNSIWSMLYGEIFVNLESFTSRTTEIKNILLDEYKKIFAFGIVSMKVRPGFENEWLDDLRRQSSLAGNGINTESLTAIRTRFILDWYANYAKKYPFKLFDLQRQLLQDGLFESYNQWLFGSVENMTAYQSWTAAHSADYNNFNQFQRSRLFKIPTGQYYNK